MSAFGIHYDVTGEDVVAHDMLSFADRAVDARPALRSIADHMRQIEQEAFASGGFGTWPSLADSTRAYKQAHGLPPQILVAEHDLEDSLTKHGGDNVEVITEDELLFGSTDPVGGFHQRGHTSPTPLPQRKVLDFTEGHIRGFTREIQAFLVEGEAAVIAGAGGGGIPPGLV